MTSIFLIIQKGLPFSKGERIHLNKKEISIGRHNLLCCPDISFTSPFISRQHALITIEEDQYWLKDQNSTNGTWINNQKLQPHIRTCLSANDVIILANKEAVLTILPVEKEIPTLKPASPEGESPVSNVQFIEHQRKVIIGDKEEVLSGKTFPLFKLLFENNGNVLTHNDIRKAVWPERAADDNGIPLAGEEEIAMLVMRLRKKLGTCSRLILNVRGHGYMFDSINIGNL